MKHVYTKLEAMGKTDQEIRALWSADGEEPQWGLLFDKFLELGGPNMDNYDPRFVKPVLQLEPTYLGQELYYRNEGTGQKVSTINGTAIRERTDSLSGAESPIPLEPQLGYVAIGEAFVASNVGDLNPALFPEFGRVAGLLQYFYFDSDENKLGIASRGISSQNDYNLVKACTRAFIEQRTASEEILGDRKAAEGSREQLLEEQVAISAAADATNAMKGEYSGWDYAIGGIILSMMRDNIAGYQPDDRFFVEVDKYTDDPRKPGVDQDVLSDTEGNQWLALRSEIISDMKAKYPYRADK